MDVMTSCSLSECIALDGVTDSVGEAVQSVSSQRVEGHVVTSFPLWLLAPCCPSSKKPCTGTLCPPSYLLDLVSKAGSAGPCGRVQKAK
jgi:hypothetical protein